MASNPLGVKICETLGLDPKRTSDITINVIAGGVNEVTIKVLDIHNELANMDWSEISNANVTIKVTTFEVD